MDASRDRLTWLDAAALLSAPVQGAALLWRRSRPVPVMAVTLAGSLQRRDA